MLELFSIERKSFFTTCKVKFKGDGSNAYLGDERKNYGPIIYRQFNILVKNYGLVIEFDKFDGLIGNPNSSFINLIESSSNVRKYSYNKRQIKTFAKAEHLDCLPFYLYNTEETLYAAVDLDAI